LVGLRRILNSLPLYCGKAPGCGLHNDDESLHKKIVDIIKIMCYYTITKRKEISKMEFVILIVGALLGCVIGMTVDK